MSGRDRTMALAGGIVVTMMILAVVLAVVVSDAHAGRTGHDGELSETVPVLVRIAAPAAAALFAAAGVQRIAGNVDTIRRQTNGMLQREIDRAEGDDGRRLRAELADELDEIQTRPIPTQQPTAGRHTWNDGGAQ